MSGLFTDLGHVVTATRQANAVLSEGPLTYHKCCREVAKALDGTGATWDDVCTGVRYAFDELKLRTDGTPRREHDGE